MAKMTSAVDVPALPAKEEEDASMFECVSLEYDTKHGHAPPAFPRPLHCGPIPSQLPPEAPARADRTGNQSKPSRRLRAVLTSAHRPLQVQRVPRASQGACGDAVWTPVLLAMSLQVDAEPVLPTRSSRAMPGLQGWCGD